MEPDTNEARFQWDDSAETRRGLRAIETGDRSELGKLFQRYRQWLREFVSRRIDAQLMARVDASDIVQETLMDVHARLPDYMARRPMSFRSWILKSAMDRLSKTRRTHRAACRNVVRESAGPLDGMDSARPVFDESTEPIHQLLRTEVITRVRQVLGAMPELDCEIIMLRNVEGLEIREIASILGISEDAARKRHGRALVRLHQEWTKRGLEFTL